MTTLFTDLREALRAVSRRPGYALTVIGILALGIGAATTVFALIDGVLLKSLPYPQAERLVVIEQRNAGGRWNTSAVDVQAIQAEQSSFEAVTAVQTLDVVMTGTEQPQWLRAGWATSGLLRVMGIAPARGRGFEPGDDVPGADRVVVVGDAFAQRQFGAAVHAVGRRIDLDGTAFTIVGVLPAGVEQLPGMRADVWPALQLAPPQRRGPFQFRTVARLKADATLAQAQAELAAISERLFPVWSAGFPDRSAQLTPRPFREAVVGDSGQVLWIAFAAVVAVLLIAWINIANLVLMRVTERARDLGVRSALGASRRRLVRLLVSESLVLAILGGLAGLMLAALLLELYRSIGPSLPRLAQVAIDGRVALFAGAAMLACGLGFGVLPLLSGALGGAGRSDLKARASSAGAGQQRIRNGLVVVEFALALPLLLAAVLLVASLQQLQRVDPGFDADNLLTARLRLAETSHPDAAARLAFWQRALPELRALPGVLGAELATGLPPDQPWTVNNFDIVGRSVGAGSQPISPWTAVGADYFGVLGVPLLEGRVFNAADTPDTPPVIVVSRAWAQRHFPGESPLGRQLHEGGDTQNPVTIVGVVGDVKFEGLKGAGDAVFAPLSQGWPNNPIHLHLRTGIDPLTLVEPLRAALQRLDPSLVPTEVTTMAGRLHDSLGDQRHWTAVIAAFALAAVLLSAVGVFAVLSYFVSRQLREIGIRLALGADARQIGWMVVRRGFGFALAGIGLGLLLSLAATRGLGSLLFAVGGTDPAMVALACGLLLAIAFVACWLPARRAARIDPIIALRHD